MFRVLVLRSWVMFEEGLCVLSRQDMRNVAYSTLLETSTVVRIVFHDGWPAMPASLPLDRLGDFPVLCGHIVPIFMFYGWRPYRLC